MTIPRHEEAPGRDSHRGPQVETEDMIVSILSIVALANKSTRNRHDFCRFINEY